MTTNTVEIIETRCFLFKYEALWKIMKIIRFEGLLLLMNTYAYLLLFVSTR